jgi:cyclic pyranopterin phosphate synthase
MPSWAIDEYLRIIKLFVSLGIEKVRLTGSEPLLRNGLIVLIQEFWRNYGPSPVSSWISH